MDDYLSKRAPVPRSSTRPVVIALLGAFALGGALTAYGVYQFGDLQSDKAVNRSDAPVVRAAQVLPPVPMPSATTTYAARQAAQAVERVEEQQGGLDQRIAAAEQRIARLDLQGQAAAGNAARAEGLLIAFSARRALDRGKDLGFLADQLRLRFGDAMPNAVQTVVAFGQSPVTLDQLVAQLDGMAGQLSDNNRSFSWEQVRGELAQLFVVRSQTTPSPQPRLRLERARLFLQSGRVNAAVAEVRNLPGAANAGAWIRNALRYAAVQDALDLIETAAVLEPRRLRDGAGNPIGQSSPVTAVPVPALPPSGAQ
jgi:hypothetical protein